MNLSIILFLIGILGFILNRKNIILLIISIEIMLLAVNQANVEFPFYFISITITYLLYFFYLENVFNIPLDFLNLEFCSITALT
jgi:NADH:ubiquinone oxidoreductase subunit K